MNYVLQQEDSGCLRACIASILEVDYYDVPATPIVFGQWLFLLNEELAEDLGHELVPIDRQQHHGPFIGVVNSQNSFAGGHALIMIGCGDFDVVAFDPLKGVMDDHYVTSCDVRTRYVLERIHVSD